MDGISEEMMLLQYDEPATGILFYFPSKNYAYKQTVSDDGETANTEYVESTNSEIYNLAKDAFKFREHLKSKFKDISPSATKLKKEEGTLISYIKEGLDLNVEITEVDYYQDENSSLYIKADRFMDTTFRVLSSGDTWNELVRVEFK